MNGNLLDEQSRIAQRMDAVELLLGERPTEPIRNEDGDEGGVVVPSPSKPTRKSLRAGLSAATIADIRSLAADGRGYNDLASDYGVSRSTIGNVVQRKGCYA